MFVWVLVICRKLQNEYIFYVKFIYINAGYIYILISIYDISIYLVLQTSFFGLTLNIHIPLNINFNLSI